MPLINCKIILILTLSENCILTSDANDGQVTTFAITDTKLYVPVVFLTKSNQRQCKTINWNKYQSKVTKERQNQYLDNLIVPSF